MENPTFHLEGIIKNKDEVQDFTVPLNLILMLLSKNKIDIRDLRISDILEQYLGYLDKMQEMDLDIASEFVQMASHLVYIKTRTLLADEKDVEELEELMSSLEQLKCRDAYLSIKEVVPRFSAAMAHGSLLFSKPAEPLKRLGNQEYRYSHKPHELLSALLTVFSRGNKPPESPEVLIPKRVIYGVKEKSNQLISLLVKEKRKSLKELYSLSHSRSEVVATFISVLELCSLGSMLVFEDKGEMYVKLLKVPDCEMGELISE